MNGGLIMLTEKMIRKDFLPYALPMLEEEEIEEVVKVLRSGWISKGPKTVLFEKEFADYIGVKHAIAMNSCTAALHISLIAAGIKPGDEVITTPFTFASTVNTIIHAGATPVFTDVDPLTGNLDPRGIEAKITERTKAIVPVHYGGQACDMDPILDIARKYNLFVSEDAAHAVGTQYKGKMVGTLGHAASFSFYATKNITTGEGGMLTTNDEELAEKARVISLHGMSKNAWNRYTNAGSWYYEVMYPGFKYNMTDIQAALGLHQLKKLQRFLKIREEYAKIYNDAFYPMPEIIPPYVKSYGRHSWHLYTIRLVPECLTIGRDEFIEELKKENIGTSVHFIPVHLHPYYRNTFGYKRGDFPVAEAFYDQLISLPLYPKMTREDVEDVIHAVRRIVGKYRR